MTSQLLGLEFCAVRKDTLYSNQDYEQGNLYKKSSLYFIGWSFRNWKIAADLQLVENGTFQPKFDKIYLLKQHSQPVYDAMQKKIKNTEFVQGVSFQFIDSPKKQRYKVLVNI